MSSDIHLCDHVDDHINNNFIFPFSLLRSLFLYCETQFSSVSSGHAIFKVTYLSNHDYKPLYFESDAATVNEIVLKVSYGWMSVLSIACFGCLCLHFVTSVSFKHHIRLDSPIHAHT